jgi:hypothetical protein
MAHTQSDVSFSILILVIIPGYLHWPFVLRVCLNQTSVRFCQFYMKLMVWFERMTEVPLNLTGLGADYYCSNCHKWLFANLVRLGYLFSYLVSLFYTQE